jgi:aryl-alcohol dehydrogenase-like predicted oxidoreductase
MNMRDMDNTTETLKRETMHRQRLGTSDLLISPIGFGAWAIGGGDWAFGWGPQEDADSISAIERAVELGINWIDTAAVYGLGRSEEVMARALKNLPESRRPYVFTKCSLTWGDDRKVVHTLKADSIRRECEASLQRLQVETIDLYQIHWPAFPRESSDADIEEGWQTLVGLQREGKVRHIGVSNFDVGQMTRIARIAPIISLQPPYSMLRRAIEAEVLPYCQAHDIGVIVYSPMLSGMLTGAMTRERVAGFPSDDWRRTNPEFQEPRLSRNLDLVERLRAIGQPHGRAPGEVAIAWVLRHPAVTGAIVGARRPSQVEGIVGAGTFRLSTEELADIENMLPDPAPVRG